jgi:hypothetical protein
VNFRQQQLRVSQDSRQRIIQFVAKHFPEIFLPLLERFQGTTHGVLRTAQSPLNQSLALLASWIPFQETGWTYS